MGLLTIGLILALAIIVGHVLGRYSCRHAPTCPYYQSCFKHEGKNSPPTREELRTMQ